MNSGFPPHRLLTGVSGRPRRLLQAALSSLFGSLCLLLSAILLFLASCVDGGPQPRSAGFSQETQQTFDAMVRDVLQANGIPGGAVGVWSADRQWIRAFGTADLASGAPMHADCRFRIGSITKTFVATVMMQLVDEGRIRLEDTVAYHLPELPIPGGASITLRHLANMTSGLYDYYAVEGFAAETYDNALRGYTPFELIESALPFSPLFVPGEEWDYSNTNYLLLGMVIEKVTRSRLDSEIRSRILVPAGLANTSFPETAAMSGSFSRGYFSWPEGTGLVDYTKSNPSVAWAAGAMTSTLEDLKQWSYMLSEGTLLSEAAHEQMRQWTVIPGTEGRIRYGLGMFYMDGFLGHGGRIVGYTTSMFRLPEEDTTILVLLNKYGDDDYSGEDTDWAREIFWDIAAFLFPDRFTL